MKKELICELTVEEILDSQENVAELLCEDDLNAIGRDVVSGYLADRDSRHEWEERNEDAMKLALQVAEEKSTPWPGAANIKYPLLTTAAVQFSSRAYPALIPGTNIVKGRVTGFDLTGEKLDRAIRIGKHMSYQLLEEMEDWEEEMDKLCLTLPILGCIFKKTYFNPVKNINVSEVVYPSDLVINYYSPNIEASERVTHTLTMTDNDIYERKAMGIYLDVELKKGDILATEEDRDRGLETPDDDDETTPHYILEQHCLLDLDKDGYKEPYIVTVHEDSEKVLRITPRYTEDELVMDSTNEVLIRIKPIQYFTKYGFIPSPDGSLYDLGFGTLLGPMNKTINTLINQLLDAGTMSNLQAGFISKGIRVKGGAKAFTPGEWKQTESYGDDLRKGIYPLPTREPSNVLFQLLGTIVDSGERLASVTEMMSGDIPGQNTKATVALAAIEQGMKVFNAIYKRIYRSMKKEFRKLYDLNAKHVGMEEYFAILDVGQEMVQKISVIDYQMKTSDVIPYADASVATEEQKLAKLAALGELLQLGTINPQEYTKRYLEATDQPNIQQLMTMPQRGPDIEQLKFEDESKRAWKELELREMEITGKLAKDEVDAIVALEGSGHTRAKIEVDKIQAENKKAKANESGSKGLEKSSTDT